MNALIKIDSNYRFSDNIDGTPEPEQGGRQPDIVSTTMEVLLGPINFDKAAFISKIKESNLSLTNSSFPDIPWEDSFDESSMIPISFCNIDTDDKFLGFRILNATQIIPDYNSETHTLSTPTYVIKDSASGFIEGSIIVDVVEFTYEAVLK
jgi:hypothetical protein